MVKQLLLAVQNLFFNPSACIICNNTLKMKLLVVTLLCFRTNSNNLSFITYLSSNVNNTNNPIFHLCSSCIRSRKCLHFISRKLQFFSSLVTQTGVVNTRLLRSGGTNTETSRRCPVRHWIPLEPKSTLFYCSTLPERQVQRRPVAFPEHRCQSQTPQVRCHRWAKAASPSPSRVNIRKQNKH